MPVRAFLDSDNTGKESKWRIMRGFQCPSGHFLIQTGAVFRGVNQYTFFVSMPVRAFLDSDRCHRKGLPG